jgi:acyl carrier protein
MWSTNDPPDSIEGTEPIRDIEDAFGIQISDNESLDLYDRDLDQAVRMIIEIRKKQRMTMNDE